MRKIFLYTGGLISVTYVILHILFWKLFNWNEELARLSTMNKGLMLILDAAATYLFAFIVFVTVYLAGLKEFTFIEKALICFIAGLYVLRILWGFAFIGFTLLELACWVSCIIAASSYLLALRDPGASSSR